jgi:hypothetical protein
VPSRVVSPAGQVKSRAVVSVHDYEVPSDDEVSRVLAEHGVTEDRIQSVRRALLRWFQSRPPEQPFYILPRARVQDDSPILTSKDMVTHLRRFTGLGRSYVELYIAGGLTNPHVSLEDALARLEQNK